MKSNEILGHKTCMLFHPYYTLTSMKISAHNMLVYPLQPTDLSVITKIIVEQAMNISKEDAQWTLGCPKKTLFLNFVSSVEPLVRTSSPSPRKNFSVIDP